jgi:hypothetical protein
MARRRACCCDRESGTRFAPTSLLLLSILSPFTVATPAQAVDRLLVPHERVWSAPEDRLSDPSSGGRVGRFEKNGSGGYNVYDKKGQPLGIGRPRPDGSVDLYDTRGQRGIEVKPERSRRR